MRQSSATNNASVPAPPLTDYHCHLLPGIDDGPGHLSESVEMARLLACAGYRAVHCTPHMIHNRYDADNNTVIDIIGETQRELDREGILLKLLYGREYYLDEFLLQHLKKPMPLEGTRQLLVEIPPGSIPEFTRDAMSEILALGFTIMIAHPERCPLLGKTENRPKLTSFFDRLKPSAARIPEPLHTEAGILEWLIARGCAFQGNLCSFYGAYGRTAQSNAGRFRAAEIYTCYGTDAHSPEDLKDLPGIVNRFFHI